MAFELTMTPRVFLLIGMMLALPLGARAQEAGERYVVLIGGLGGEAAYTEKFRQYLFDAHRAFTGRFGVPAANVTVLAEKALEGQPFVDGVATAEAVGDAFARLARRVGPDDHVYVVLFGHGSYDGTRARLNIPRRDLDDADYAALVGGLGAGRLVFINTAGASGPFVEVLRAPGRVVITATRSGSERNETVFPRAFLDALTNPAADLDRDGALTVREVFVYAARAVARSFEETGHLATEHALLEDTGAGPGLGLDALDAGSGGALAGVTYLRRTALAAGPLDDAQRRRLREKEEIERAVADLKARKTQFDEDAYYARLESLFIRLARLNDLLERGN